MGCLQNVKPGPDKSLNDSFALLQIHIQDFAFALLENFNCIVGVITSSLTASISIKDILQKV